MSCDCPCKVLYKSFSFLFLICPYSIIRHVCSTTVLCLKRFYNQFIEGRGKWLYECIRIKAIDFKLIFPLIIFPQQFSLLLLRLDLQSQAELLSLGWPLALVARIQMLNNNVRRGARCKNIFRYGKEWFSAPEFPFKLSRSLSFWPNNYIFFLFVIYKWNICKLWHRVINSCTFKLYCY